MGRWKGGGGGGWGGGGECWGVGGQKQAAAEGMKFNDKGHHEPQGTHYFLP